jgi:Na+-translocating ferredoxin:NAD+ oxidoreductase subunit G
MSMGMSGGPPRAPARETRSWQLLAMMTGAGGIAGLLIVTAFQATLPRIEKHQAEVMADAIREVLKEPARYDTLYAVNDRLVRSLPTGVDAKTADRIFLGYDASGQRVGFAMAGTGNGFQDPITLMFGYDAAGRKVIAMKVVANRETPGLGNKIETDSAFLHGFVAAEAPLDGVKKDRGRSKPNDVVMITGATISSRAVIRIINEAIARWQPLMDAYREGEKP